MTNDEISDIVELMSLNHDYLTDVEKDVYDKICVLDEDEYHRISSDSFKVMKDFVPVLSERKAKILNWIKLDEDAPDFSSIGYRNLEQIIGMSSSVFIDKILSNDDDYGRRKHLGERKNINDALTFLDFYVRFANNSVMEKELFERIEDLSDKVDFYLKDDFPNTCKVYHDAPSYGSKETKLKDILVLLRSEERKNKMRDKVNGLEKFINFSHFVEPSVIPHVFGCKNSSGQLQSLIIHVLDALANSDITELKNNNDDEYQWVLERNSEHKRKIKPMKKKRIQEVTRRHIFRKNVIG